MISSTKWKMWKTILDLKTCLSCRQNNGKIYDINKIVYPALPLHLNCRCTIERLKAIFAGSATKKEFEGADWYLKVHGKLPDYYITYETGRRGAERILFSNDGLIFVTYDHYDTFIEIM